MLGNGLGGKTFYLDLLGLIDACANYPINILTILKHMCGDVSDIKYLNYHIFSINWLNVELTAALINNHASSHIVYLTGKLTYKLRSNNIRNEQWERLILNI